MAQMFSNFLSICLFSINDFMFVGCLVVFSDIGYLMANLVYTYKLNIICKQIVCRKHFQVSSFAHS